jgi:hypothetical protein
MLHKPDEKIIRVGELGIVRVRHSIERANGARVLVHDVKIGIILFEDDLAQRLFVRSADVVVV